VSTLFPPILEQRYSDYARLYSVEYHVDSRTKLPDAKGACATLASAKAHAVRALALDYVKIVRIFDREIGQYLFTYKRNLNGISIHEGYTK
jgi:hypothetical protein